MDEVDAVDFVDPNRPVPAAVHNVHQVHFVHKFRWGKGDRAVTRRKPSNKNMPRVTSLGVAVGLLGALLLGGALQTLLFGVSGRDGVTFLSVGGLMAAAVLLACYLPSRRASRMDPAAVLRRL